MVLLGLVAWVGLSGGATTKDPLKLPITTTVKSHAKGQAPRTTATRPAPPTTTTTIPHPSLVPSPSYGTFMPTIVDQANGVSLPTEVLYPTTSSGAPVPGKHPLIVFAEGYLALPSYYSDLLSTWAKAGFVVAAPIFPNTNAAAATPDESDDLSEPGEVTWVIESLITLGHSPNNVLEGIIDPTAIGLAGHSDGGDVMSALAYDSAYAYPGIGATAILSGAELPGAEGSYFDVASPSPLLVVQGLDDPSLNPPTNSEQLYQDDPGAKYYLQLTHGTHWTPYSLDPTALTAFPTGLSSADLSEMAQQELPVTEKVTTDFFEAQLVPSSEVTPGQITADGSVPGVSTISAAGVGG